MYVRVFYWIINLRYECDVDIFVIWCRLKFFGDVNRIVERNFIFEFV